jgi:hypothetical protein
MMMIMIVVARLERHDFYGCGLLCSLVAAIVEIESDDEGEVRSRRRWRILLVIEC